MSLFEFNNLVINNADYLRPFAITLTQDSEDAKDLLQETLYRALANKEKYNVGTNIKAWLFTIMRNIFINNYRRKSKRNSVIESSDNTYILNSGKNAIVNNGVNILNEKEINKAVYSLPESFRNPFVLYFNGYKYNEISEMLNEPLGTIKSRIHFARRLLQKNIERF